MESNGAASDDAAELAFTLPWGTRVTVDDAVIRAMVIAVLEAGRGQRTSVGSTELLRALVADGEHRLMSSLTDFGINAGDLRDRILASARGSERRAC
jgi:hypothetical protein